MRLDDFRRREQAGLECLMSGHHVAIPLPTGSIELLEIRERQREALG